jgi:site-specific recombinase XerD
MAAGLGAVEEGQVAEGCRKARPVRAAHAGGPGRSESRLGTKRLLPRLAAKAGVEKRVHPHGLRHAYAAELAAEGVPVNVVQQQLGHGSLATTDRYLRHIAPREPVDTMQAREWAV